MTYAIEPIDFSLVEAFYAELGQEIPTAIRLQDRCYGVIEVANSKLIGLGIIGAPRLIEDRVRFRTQIIAVNFRSESDSSLMRSTLIDGIKSVGPVDLFDPDSQELWTNPDLTFYIYKITSTENDGYYIGRHLLRGANISDDNCVNDGYWGSGGKRFQQWKSGVAETSLRKTILSRHQTWAEITLAEAEAIGDLYKTDYNCKNYVPGGVGSGGYTNGLGPLIKPGECDLHGEVSFSGDSCLRCVSQSSLREDACEIHGLTIHRNTSCLRCAKEAGYRKDLCPIHGESTFSKTGCWSCIQASTYSLKICEVHGPCKHQGNSCISCYVEKSVDLKRCGVHGLTTHSGSSCYRCRLIRTVTVKLCENHGETKHKGNHCYSCMAENIHESRICADHGLTTFLVKSDNSAQCYRCKAKERDSLKKCDVHGLTPHAGDSCYRCSAIQSVAIKLCPTHGESKHRGSICQQCVANNRYTDQDCPTHGETIFMGNRCMKCRDTAVSVKFCEIHGETKFKKDSCCKCIAARRYSEQNCDVHGLSRFSGKSCIKCSKEKQVAVRLANSTASTERRPKRRK